MEGAAVCRNAYSHILLRCPKRAVVGMCAVLSIGIAACNQAPASHMVVLENTGDALVKDIEIRFEGGMLTVRTLYPAESWKGRFRVEQESGLALKYVDAGGASSERSLDVRLTPDAARTVRIQFAGDGLTVRDTASGAQ